MPITEYALMQLRDGYDELDFLEVVMQCHEAQDDWVRLNQPHTMHTSSMANLSTIYIDKSHPRHLLITAPWDSPEAHGEWIKSKDNQHAFANLARFLAPGPHSTVLFHLEHIGTHQQLQDEFDGESHVNVCRMTVKPGQKQEVEKVYRTLQEDVYKKNTRPRIWAGWRIETCGDEEDIVIFWSNKVAEEQLTDLLALSDQKDRRSVSWIV
ncbi:hypothetical protein S7711_06943 [Stachybotrys chartarum IBT 7711]|uniref:ABM domain-containing protein n=1 Tax=Stachybotrys chartarum (strain CBS 109288 / IBT 7711) TaxID=1280523 RepID=A0A084ARV1_STACB|nr:hypothetical protein S7711_06943 [Stachybotrys chartarum IBT 7711]